MVLIASELDNLTIADPMVNRSQKGARNAAEWRPTHHGAWFAERVIRVKLEYGLTVDTAERDALVALLAGGGAQLHCVNPKFQRANLSLIRLPVLSYWHY